MPEYPQLARTVTDLRKRGDIDGAINIFKSSDTQEKQLPEVRSAMAWVLYDRDIKPISPAAQRDDPTLDVTDVMVRDAIEAVEKIRTWCNRDPYSRFSAFPLALLMVAKILRTKEMNEQLRVLLESIDATKLVSVGDGQYSSPQAQWVGLALDTVKNILAPANATTQRVRTAEPLLIQLRSIEKAGSLSDETPQIKENGRTRRIPSHRQRFYLQYTRFLQEVQRMEELAQVCRTAINENVFEHNPNLKWMLYRLALALKEVDPREALRACDDFVALEDRPYALLLRAELLLACGDKPEALIEAAHSLQIITEKDLPYISKNLRFLADCTDDAEVKRTHIQMIRYLRTEQGQAPNPELEQLAHDLDLPPADEAPSVDDLRASWNAINPDVRRRQGLGRAVPTSNKKQSESRARIDTRRFKRDQKRLGDVIMAKIPTKDGTDKFRPVVIIGHDAGELLVGPLQSNSTHPKAIAIEKWQEAGLNRASMFVPYWHVIKDDRQRVLGHLDAADRESVSRNT